MCQVKSLHILPLNGYWVVTDGKMVQLWWQTDELSSDAGLTNPKGLAWNWMVI